MRIESLYVTRYCRPRTDILKYTRHVTILINESITPLRAVHGDNGIRHLGRCCVAVVQFVVAEV